MQRNGGASRLTNSNTTQQLTEPEIIEGCKRGDAAAQKELYVRFGAKMYGVCCRYVGHGPEAEDLLHDGFLTIYTKAGDFRGEGSFEGWCRRIMVNAALSALRRRSPLTGADDVREAAWIDSGGHDAIERMSEQELLDAIGRLPDGYRAVVNLYAVEGYSHREIGEMLGISENTSRSQYSRARARLIEMIG